MSDRKEQAHKCLFCKKKLIDEKVPICLRCRQKAKSNVVKGGSVIGVGVTVLSGIGLINKFKK